MAIAPAPIAEIRRGPFIESIHCGHAVICDASGGVIAAWGDPEAVVLPRSSAKMIQALPLITSGAADRFGLTDAQLALACASHQGATLHTDAVTRWLGDLGLDDDALRCGPEVSRDPEVARTMIREGAEPCQVHNNCSGKHAGFLTLNRHLGGEAEYINPDHPVQVACRAATEDVTQEDSPGYGIDGCSAPNFATTMHGMARAMAYFASAHSRGDSQSAAATRLVQAMYAHPVLVAGEGRACTRLMRAVTEPVALKTGAEGFFVAILPERQIGIAVKAADGATRAAECAIAALLVRLGAAQAGHPDVAAFLTPVLRNRRDIAVGEIRPAPGLLS
ncbi:asparaginase [Thalassococcus sp. BH17M4-6]|uniref:asparaginase n=1 Tax=Thalassococcus sp. BH17M4-6 TaxID=3413148 RepID=UPI003BD4B6CB